MIEGTATPLPPLAVAGGPPRAVLLLVHPRRLYLYWVLDAGLREIFERFEGPAGLRLEKVLESGELRELGRHELDLRASGWYVTPPETDCRVQAHLGVEDRDGFRTLLVSNLLRIPREGTGDESESWRDPRAKREAQVSRAAGSSPSGKPAWQRRAGVTGGLSKRATARPPAVGSLALVLHAHLPFIRHPERQYFLEEHWLFEAITETYLPLLDLLEDLCRDRVPARLTMSLTPTLMAMLRDPVLMAKYARHLDGMIELSRRELARTRGMPEMRPIAGFYRDRLRRFRQLFHDEYGGDLVGGFARLEARGVLEIIGCAATHGLLPALLSPEAVRAQILLGVREHRRQLGRRPSGFWLPECGYFEGLDQLLSEAEVDYFFVDAHGFRQASHRPRLDLHAPILTPAGVAAFARDQETTVQVWSSKEGYPGDPEYRDFYRDIGFDLEWETVGEFLDPAGTRGMTGFKYHRITGATDGKQPYRRDVALQRVAVHARDFLENRRRQMEYLARPGFRKPLVTSMYDAELFGHWWFEGPEWLAAVLREAAEHGIRTVSPGDYLQENPVTQESEPSTSSWGEGGYFDVWVNPKTDWIYPPLHDAARRLISLVERRGAGNGSIPRALAQAGRELLLAQSSDWPFILRNETAVGYARERVLRHLDRFRRLADSLEAGRVDETELAALEAQDNLFPDLDMAAWRRA